MATIAPSKPIDVQNPPHGHAAFGSTFGQWQSPEADFNNSLRSRQLLLEHPQTRGGHAVRPPPILITPTTPVRQGNSSDWGFGFCWPALASKGRSSALPAIHRTVLV